MALLMQMAKVFSILSLVSIGGANSTLSEIRRQVVDVHGWMSGAAFNDVFAISHAAPGPNIIMVSLIGWQISGMAGLLVATLAIMIPSCTLAFLASRMLLRYSDHRYVALLKAGLVPVALGLILASGISMMRMAHQGMVTILISLGATAAVVLCTRNPLWVLAVAAGVNAIAVQFGWAFHGGS